MTNLIHKMALIWNPLCNQNNAQNMRKVENYQTSQRLASFWGFFHQNIFFSWKHLMFSRSVFSYKSPASPAVFFNFSPVFTNHRSLFPSLVILFWHQIHFFLRSLSVVLDYALIWRDWVFPGPYWNPLKIL